MTQPQNADQHRDGGPSRSGRTIAWFDSPEDARAAEKALERNGIDSMHVAMGQVDHTAQRRNIDRRSIGWAAKRGVAELVVGAAIGALVGWLIGYLVMETSADIAAFALGGAVFGLAPGLLYSVFTSVPTDPEVFDTFADDGSGSPCLAVDGPAELRERAAEILLDNDPEPRRLVSS